MKLEVKDYIAALTAALTIGSVIWKGGEITSQLAQTNESVKALVPVVGRLDALTSRLQATAESDSKRIDEHGRRIELVEQRMNQRIGR